MSRLDSLKQIEETFINNSEYLRLKQQLEETRAQEQQEVTQLIQKLITAFEIDPSQFCGNPSGVRKSSGPVAPKYRNTVTGQTWTGRGRKPVSWLEHPEQWVEI